METDEVTHKCSKKKRKRKTWNLKTHLLLFDCVKREVLPWKPQQNQSHHPMSYRSSVMHVNNKTQTLGTLQTIWRIEQDCLWVHKIQVCNTWAMNDPTLCVRIIKRIPKTHITLYGSSRRTKQKKIRLIFVNMIGCLDTLFLNYSTIRQDILCKYISFPFSSQSIRI